MPVFLCHYLTSDPDHLKIMKHQFSLISFVFCLLLASCNAQQNSEYSLTAEEKHLCDSLGIDEQVVTLIRSKSKGKFEAFVEYNEFDSTLKRIPGLVFPENAGSSAEVVSALKSDLKNSGYTLFLFDASFGIGDKPDKLAVLKTTDKYEILHNVGTNGINYEIENDSLISIIKQLDAKYSLELVGASVDWCEFIIHTEPANYLTFSEEIYKICPDIVDQGTGSVQELATVMKSTKRLYLWWD